MMAEACGPRLLMVGRDASLSALLVEDRRRRDQAWQADLKRQLDPSQPGPDTQPPPPPWESGSEAGDEERGPEPDKHTPPLRLMVRPWPA